MSKGYKNTLDFLVFSNISVALPISCFAYQTFILTGSESINYTILVLIYFSTLFLYCFHRIFPKQKSEKDEMIISHRYQWLLNNKTLFITIMVLSLTGVLVSLFFVKLIVILCLIPLGILSFGYIFPIIKRNIPKDQNENNYIRLRDIPGLKIFLIAIIIGLITVVLPIVSTGKIELLFSTDVKMMIIERILFLFAITIPFDIRDMVLDDKFDLKTIPLIFGIKKSILFANFSLLLFILTLIVHYFIVPQFEIHFMISMIISAIITAFIISRSSLKRSEYFYSILIEGTMVIQCVLVILADKI